MEASTESQRSEEQDEQRDGQEQERSEEKSQNGSEKKQGATGRVEEVQGVVIEASFPDGELPEIFNALEIDLQQHGAQDAGRGCGHRPRPRQPWPW